MRRNDKAKKWLLLCLFFPDSDPRVADVEDRAFNCSVGQEHFDTMHRLINPAEVLSINGGAVVPQNKAAFFDPVDDEFRVGEDKFHVVAAVNVNNRQIADFRRDVPVFCVCINLDDIGEFFLPIEGADLLDSQAFGSQFASLFELVGVNIDRIDKRGGGIGRHSSRTFAEVRPDIEHFARPCVCGNKRQDFGVAASSAVQVVDESYFVEVVFYYGEVTAKSVEPA